MGADLRILVLGTGAMGSLFAARLARDGSEVTVAGSWQPALERIARQGIAVEGTGPTWRAAVTTRPIRAVDGQYDLVLVLTKSWRSAAVAPTAARAAGSGGVVLTLQNGLGNREILAAAAGDERVAGGTTRVGATLLGPGRVRPGGRGATLIGGAESLRPQLTDVAHLLTAAGIPTEVTGDYEGALWTKVAINCAINPLSAIAGLENGRLVELGVWRRELEAAAREVGAVAGALGVKLGVDPALQAVATARSTRRNRSSMLQDITAGRPTEIDALCGAVAERGRRLGVPTPVNDRLAQRIRTMESAAGTPRRPEPAS